MRMARNVLTGNPILAGYEEYRAFSNMDGYCDHAPVHVADRYLDVLLTEHPDSLFILNVRDFDNWARSVLQWYSNGDAPRRARGRHPYNDMVRKRCFGDPCISRARDWTAVPTTRRAPCSGSGGIPGWRWCMTLSRKSNSSCLT